MIGTSDFLSVDAILSMVGIVIGLTIFLMQRKADSKINRIIETQFRRQELEKKYFGSRLLSNLQLVKKNHVKLAQYLTEYLKDRSQVNKNKIKNFSNFQSREPRRLRRALASKRPRAADRVHRRP